jgi:hypothetical protein
MTKTNSAMPEGRLAGLPAWGHGSGLLSLRDSVAPSDAPEAADRLLIIERIYRYCWGYDERRLEQLSACFTEDAIWEGSVLGKVRIGPFVGRAKIVDWLAGFWPHQHDQRRHMILNTIVEEQTKSSATTLSYLILASSNSTAVAVETTGFYKVKCRRSESVWQIEHLLAGFDAPFWPGDIRRMSDAGRARHGITTAVEIGPDI